MKTKYPTKKHGDGDTTATARNEEAMQATDIITRPPTQVMDLERAKDVAARVADICEQCSVTISGKKYLKVEGWQSIAAEDAACPEITGIEYVEAHGDMPSGVRAHAVLKRLSDGYVLSAAYGYVGTDEATTGPGKFWYAKEGKAQTRAVSRVCRHRYAYVVVLMNKGFETTPFEEMDNDGGRHQSQPLPTRPKRQPRKTEPVPEPTKITGKITDIGTKDNNTGITFYWAQVGDVKLITSDKPLGQALHEFKDNEIIAEVTPTEKQNVFKLEGFKTPQEEE